MPVLILLAFAFLGVALVGVLALRKSDSKETVVERQVLVTRCAHCAELTPVDLSACRSCGARLG